MKHSKGINGVEDRLSDMPDDLIVHILSFLPTLDAVKTMLLRRFGNLWTLVPVLSFNFDDLDSILSHRVDDSDSDEVDYSDSDEVFSCFTRFVRNVLMFHRNPTVDRFHLIISRVGYELEDPKIINDLQMWLKFAIDKQVKDLNFFYDDGFHDVPIPRCIFTSQSLVKLRLRGCKLEHQPHLHVHMGSLRELSLSYVRGRDENFNQFLSGCPCLQEVEMDIIGVDDELHVLKVTSPSVRKLCLNLLYLVHSFTLSCPYVKRLDISVSSRHKAFMPDVVAASSLQVVNIKNLPEYLSEVKAFFRQIRNAEVFTLSSNAFDILSQGMKTNFPPNRWKRIVLWPRFIGEESLQLILELAKSSENLEELVIYNEFSSRNGEYRNPEFSATTTTTYVMPHLKNVAIHGCGRFCDGQLLLIKLLLRKAVVLEKLIIKSRLTPPEELDFVKQVSTFKMASANATVIFA